MSAMVAQGVAHDFRQNRPSRPSRAQAGLDLGRNIFAPILGDVSTSAKPSLFGVYLGYEANRIEFCDPYHAPDQSAGDRERYICDSVAVVGDSCTYTP